MNKTLRYILSILGFLLVIYLFWYFRNIVSYIIIAAVISFIGQPLVHLLDRIKIGRIVFPHTLSCIITLIALLGIFCSFVALFVPLIVYEAEIISQIDYVTIGKSLEQPLASVQTFLSTYGILPPGKTVENELVTRMSIKDDSTDVSNEDFEELLTNYLNGDQIEKDYPTAINIQKKLFEENGQLCAIVSMDFPDLATARLYQRDKKSPYMPSKTWMYKRWSLAVSLFLNLTVKGIFNKHRIQIAYR